MAPLIGVKLLLTTTPDNDIMLYSLLLLKMRTTCHMNSSMMLSNERVRRLPPLSNLKMMTGFNSAVMILFPALKNKMKYSMLYTCLLTYLPPLPIPCVLPFNDYPNLPKTKYSLLKQNGLPMSVQRFTTYNRTHKLPGNTFVSSLVAPLVITKRKSQWQ